MSVPQAGKTVFNQSTFILIIRASFGVRCPHFETEETENKHGPPGKENTDESAPLCLSVWVCPTFFFPPLCANTPLAHTLTGMKMCMKYMYEYFIYICKSCKTKQYIHYFPSILCEVLLPDSGAVWTLCRPVCGAATLQPSLYYYSCKCASQGEICLQFT